MRKNRRIVAKEVRKKKWTAVKRAIRAYFCPYLGEDEWGLFRIAGRIVKLERIK